MKASIASLILTTVGTLAICTNANAGALVNHLENTPNSSSGRSELVLGLRNSTGANGQATNYPIAMHWFQKAAVKGNVRAEYEIGSLYANGLGVPANVSRARRWFMKCLRDAKGKPDLIVTTEDALASLYWNNPLSLSNDDNLEKAIYWLRKAAYKGDIRPEIFLINAYDCGELATLRCHSYGLKFRSIINHERANFWIRKILHQKSYFTWGQPGGLMQKRPTSDKDSYWEDNANFARYELGMHYYRGDGVKQNSLKALHWLKITKQNAELNGDSELTQDALKAINLIKHE